MQIWKMCKMLGFFSKTFVGKNCNKLQKNNNNALNVKYK